MQILPPLLAVIFLLLSLGGTYYTGHIHGQEDVQVRWDREKASLIAAQHDKERALQANMDKLRENKNRETARLNATVRALTHSLRDRPERPAVGASAAVGNDAAGCNGAELYRPDAEFLIGESARADSLRIALIQCQAAYQADAGH